MKLRHEIEMDTIGTPRRGSGNVATGKAQRNPWGFLPQKPLPFANSSTGCAPLDVVECHYTRGYIPSPHPGRRGDHTRRKGYDKRHISFSNFTLGRRGLLPSDAKLAFLQHFRENDHPSSVTLSVSESQSFGL
jgi:hypothetical protein